LKLLKGRKLLNKIFPKNEIWSKQIRDLLNDIDDDMGPKDIYDIIISHVINPEIPCDVDYVRVMSLYKSKGLSSDLIVICGCVNGLIPRRKYDLAGEELERFDEEQRRLFYVGLTRVKKEILLSGFRKVPHDFANRNQLPVRKRDSNFAYVIASPFLYELGSNKPTSIRGRDWDY
jgi:superfamily I DNA/RNA helicase